MTTSGSDVVLRCVDLRKIYILGEVRVEALRGINMTINRSPIEIHR